MDIGTALASVGAAIDTVKFLRDVDKKLDEAELKIRLADVYGGLADAKMALADARTSLAEQAAEIERLKSEFSRRDDTIEYDGMHYQVDEDGQRTGRPFCPNCYANGVLLITQPAVDAPHDQSFCPGCGNNYFTAFGQR